MVARSPLAGGDQALDNFADLGDGDGSYVRARPRRTASRSASTKTWGGPLCLLTAKRSQAELAEVRAELEKRVKAGNSGYMGVGADPVNNRVRLYVTAPSDHMQRDLDRSYGKGVVGLKTWLQAKALSPDADPRRP
ncbi:hypothetical protein [Streptomyces sp. NPDC051219]|uniref:hypothetical protein n=1 Tax=Streptomyces sp. NPDC051219 TaxID=3155283 RepID=UPI00344429A5